MPSRGSFQSVVVGLLIVGMLVVPGASGPALAASGEETATAELLVNRNRDLFVDSRSLHALGRLGDRVLFRRMNDLWLTDGTLEGTRRVCGANPQSCLLAGSALRSPASYVLLSDGFHSPLGTIPGRGVLRRSDGTEAGTFPLTDPAATRLNDRFPAHHFHVHRATERVFFQAEDLDTGSGEELWVTDGTVEGTREVADLAPGGFGSSPEFGATIGPWVVFSAEDPEAGREPWVTDGTAGGTVRLADLKPGPEASNPSSFSALGGWVLFFARGEDEQTGLYRTGGTPGGTRLLADLEEPVGFLGPDFRGLRLFLAKGLTTELWVTDGSPDGTRPLVAFPADAAPNGDAVGIGSRVLFLTGLFGTELWVTDGSAEGTRRLLASCLADCAPHLGQPMSLGDRAVFTRDDGIHGRELWITDGAPEGTRLLADFCPGPCHGGGSVVDYRDGSLLVIAGDESNLWQLQLATGTVIRLTDFPRETVLHSFFVSLGTSIVFATSNIALGQTLWSSDGTLAGTSPYFGLASPVDNSSFPEGFVRLGREIFFTVSLPEHELWATRGTGVGTRLVWRAPDDVTLLGSLTRLGDDLLFLARTRDGALDLYRSDGTPEGTLVTAEGLEGGIFSRIVVAENRAFLLNVESGRLWVTDGTAEGTRRVGNFGFIGLGNAVVFGNRLLFKAGAPEELTLWESDGSVEGTRPVAPDRIRFAATETQLTVIGNDLYFIARESVAEGDERFVVWRSDGTSAGARPVETAEGFIEATSLVAAGSRLFIVGRETTDATEGLWVTDPGGAFARRLATVSGTSAVAVDGSLFFIVRNPPAGLFAGDIWRSDGTSEGTHPVDLLPTQPGLVNLHEAVGHLLVTTHGDSHRLWLASPDGDFVIPLEGFDLATEFTRVGRRVVFAGATEETGVEPWAIDLRPRPGDPSESPPVMPRKLDR